MSLFIFPGTPGRARPKGRQSEFPPSDQQRVLLPSELTMTP